MDRYLLDIVRDRRYWEKKRHEIRLKEKRLDTIIADYQQQAERVASERRNILHEAKDEARSILAQSNAQQTRELAKELGLDIRDINECAADTVAMGIVPDVKGMGARDAVYEMQRRGLKVKLHGSGRVKEQNMPPGTHVVKGKTITLTLKE